MIECSNEIIFKKKKRRKKRNRFFAIFLLFFVLLNLYICYIITPLIARISIDYAKNCLTTSINDSILNSFIGGIKYSDLILVEKNSQGNVSLMTVNSVNANKLSKEISIRVEDDIKSKLKLGTPIPLGAFLGIPILSGYGRTVNLKSISVTFVESDFSSTFNSVGINNTIHSIYSVVSCTIKLDYPYFHKEETCVAKVLISECVLIGEIPEIYLNGRLFGI